jgi:hypothetical protein
VASVLHRQSTGQLFVSWSLSLWSARIPSGPPGYSPDPRRIQKSKTAASSLKGSSSMPTSRKLAYLRLAVNYCPKAKHCHNRNEPGPSIVPMRSLGEPVCHTLDCPNRNLASTSPSISYWSPDPGAWAIPDRSDIPWPRKSYIHRSGRSTQPERRVHDRDRMRRKGVRDFRRHQMQSPEL